MTTITENVTDIAGVDDNTSWTFATQQIRESDIDGTVITTKKVRKYPVAGVLTVELDPGPAVVLAPDGKTYPFTVPDTDSELWPLIQAAVTIPPSTTHQQLLDAVDAWLASHTDVWDVLPGRPAPLVAGANVANGYAGLDGSGKIGTAQLPISAMEYKGVWNASTNSPTLADGTGNTGDLYHVGTGANRNLGSGSISFAVNDYVIYNGATWEKSANTDPSAFTPNLVPTAVKTSAYTAAVSDMVPVDATSGTVPITLPAAPADKARIAVKKIDASVNTVTIPAGGSDVFNKSGGSTSLTLSLQNQGAVLQYKASGAIWYVVSTDVPLSGLDGRYVQPATMNAAIKVLRASKNTVAAIGDSITAWGTSPNGYTAADNYLVHLCVECDQRMQLTGIFATPGYSLSQIQSTHLPSLLAMNPLPAACVVFGGTNDMTAGTVAAAQTLLKQIVASVTAVGVAPILVALPPRSDDTNAAQRTITWNTWILRYAAQNGFGVIDTYTPLAGSNGVCLTQYQYDNVHPNWAGHRVIAQQAIRDGLPQMFPSNGTNRTSRSTADLTNLFNSGSATYGLHTVDTNSDGLADGWTVIGAGTFGKSLITPAPMDGVQGKWQQMTRTTADNASAAYGLVQFTINSGWSVGDILALSARVQTEGIESTATPWHLRLNCFQSSANNYRGPTSMQADYDGLVYNEITIPSGTTDLYLQAALQTVTNAGTAKLRFGEVTVRNLTTGGTLI